MPKRPTLKYTWLILSLLIATGIQSSFAATDIETLENRVTELETILIDTAETATRHDNGLNISAYADIELSHSTEADGSARLSPHHIALIAKQRISDKWRFHSEIEFANGPHIEFEEGNPPTCDDCSGRIFVEALNVDYTQSDQTTVRIGRFFTPTGIWSINHYPPFTQTQREPGGIHETYPHVIDGLDIMGTLLAGKNTFLNFDLFAGNGTKPSTHNGGLKLNIILPWFTSMEAGVASFHDRLPGSISQTNIAYHLLGQINKVTIQAEHSKAAFNSTYGNNYNKTGYYIQSHYSIGKHWLFGLRHDHFENTNTAPGERVNYLTNSVFTNYRIDKDTVIKLEHHYINDTINYQQTIASIAVNLGN